MFYNKQFNKYIVEGTAFELDGVQYPAGWLNQASQELKDSYGLIEVIATNQPEDSRFYWVSETLAEQYLTYTNTPKDLTQLKSDWSAQVKSQVYSILQPSDYVDVRNLRDPNYKIDWMLWRDEVRQVAANTELAIQDCNMIEELIAVVSNLTWPKDPNALEQDQNQIQNQIQNQLI